MLDQKLFQNLEEELLRPETRSSRERTDALLADDFVEFGASGRVYDKALMLAALAEEQANPPPIEREITDFTVRSLAGDLVPVTYRVTRRRKDTPGEARFLRSSIWRHEAVGWRMTLHQGTPLPGDNVSRDQFRRTVIVGNGGSGKSWLAQRLAKILGVEAVDLDMIHWEPGCDTARRDQNAAGAMVREAAAADAWVIEGVYGCLAQEALCR
ncbi:DUF4440 domain-containing protein [Microvirga tunisiensis]|uniref:DUF4440 domain-containing protein n=1 Tax=Microvirga tunisiensis TaxID=2108360 RepID=A0A5N7MFY3_9HYPH|nr:DUF4440 domain-containing protein [Microvirga tunisiensis]MPR07520.1 DUF4440 domain-containing protein [Microvirga tunisiensis]MPR25787.1 DUF4440 domain-containing protein [Microvirga tunisiensis]